MEIMFQTSEIAMLLEYALKNGGGPIQIGEGMTVERVESMGALGELKLTVVEATGAPRPKRKSPAGGAKIEARHCIECGEEFMGDARRKYCDEHIRARP